MSVRLRDMQGDWRLAWRHAPRATVVFAHAEAARRFIARWARHPEVLSALRQLLAQRQLPEAQRDDVTVLATCARLLHDGRLHCWQVVPLRASDMPQRPPEADVPATTRAPETVRALREIVPAVESGFVVRTLDAAVTTRWDTRAMEPAVETDWDARAMEPAVETDWDHRAIACEVSVEWDLLGLDTHVDAAWEDSPPTEDASESGALQ